MASASEKRDASTSNPIGIIGMDKNGNVLIRNKANETFYIDEITGDFRYVTVTK